VIDFNRYRPESTEVFVIAEIGVNHNGRVKLACDLINAAIMAGCDAVKFQVWNSDHIYPPERVGWAKHNEMKRLELSHRDLADLKWYCDQHDIAFFATPDEIEDAQFLAGLGVELMKTSSHDVTNLELLRGIRELGIPTIMSTGAATYGEVDAGCMALCPAAVLHCISAYPAPLEQMNIRALEVLPGWGVAPLTGNVVVMPLPLGLSDHTIGPYAACAALALGARIFEKHLTLDKNMPGPDHKASATPEEMAEYVKALRALAIGMGDGVKRVMPCEEAARAKHKPWLSKTS